jgi:hypothetical protein
MPYPLGPRAGRETPSDRRYVLKPAAATYLVHVRLAPEIAAQGTQSPFTDADSDAGLGSTTAALSQRKGSGFGKFPTPVTSGSSSAPTEDPMSLLSATSYASAASKAEVFTFETMDTPLTAVKRILEKLQLDPENFPPDEFMLVQCFADFSIDFNYRGLFGDLGPLKPCLNFPYYLSLQRIPYVVRRHQIYRELEPKGRNQIATEQRLFYNMCKEYAAILLGIHTQRTFLEEREDDARCMRKEQERHCYFDLAELEIFQTEYSRRRILSQQEDQSWARLGMLIQSLLTHLSVFERNNRLLLLKWDEEKSKWSKLEKESHFLRILNSRYSTLLQTTNDLCEAGIGSFRAAYTAGRIEVETKDAYLQGLRRENVLKNRIQLQLDGKGSDAVIGADIASNEVLCCDRMTNTAWMASRVGHVQQGK